MKKLLIGLIALSSISSFATVSTAKPEDTVNVIIGPHILTSDCEKTLKEVKAKLEAAKKILLNDDNSFCSAGSDGWNTARIQYLKY